MRGVALLLAAIPVLLHAAATRADPMVAEVRVNGETVGEVQFERAGDALTLDRSQLSVLRLANPVDSPSAQTASGERAPRPVFMSDVVLDDLSGVAYAIDEPTQSVDITAEAGALLTTRLGMRNRPYDPPDTPAWGLALNYAVFGIKAEDQQSTLSALGEMRVFGPFGVFTQGVSARRSEGGLGNGLRRLETSYVVEDYARARRLIVGDYVSSGTSWAPSVRAGGLRYTSDLSLRPDIINQPTPVVRGASATASSIDLYVDGVKRLETRAPPGPFVVDTVPLVDGRGQVDVVVTDALGRQTVQALPFYASTQLMRPGRTDFSIELGALREDFARETDRYTKPFVSGSLRRGLTNFFTIAGRGAARRDLQMAGAEATTKVRDEALLSAAFSYSSGERGTQGRQVLVSGRRDTPAYSLFATFQHRSNGYRDLDSRPEDLRLRQALQLGATIRTDRAGAISASYSRIKRGDGDVEVAGLTWSKGVGPVSIYASGAATGGAGGGRFTLGFSVPLGGERSSSTAVTSTAYGVRAAASISKAPPLPSGWGWRVAGERGEDRRDDRLEGEVRRLSAVGEAGFTGAYIGGRASVQGYASGSAVWMGGRPVFAQRLGEGFALIDTGAAGIPVTIENRPAGKTGRGGRLLVAQMAPQGASRIALRADEIGLSHDISVSSVTVKPPRGAGILVRMPVTPRHSAQVRFVDPDGNDIAVGLGVWVNGRQSGVIGYDGLAYLNALAPQNTVEIIGQSGRCRMEVPYDPSEASRADAGPLVCKMVHPPDMLDVPSLVADRGPGAELHGPDWRRGDERLPPH